MEQSVSQSVVATGFCLSSQSIKTRVHFFPFAGAISGPYSIACTFTLFGKGIERKSVTVDGGRLGQPDGIRLEDAFQAVRGEASGIFGLQVSLSCQNHRAMMTASQLSIEVVSPQFNVVYGVPFFLATGQTTDAGSNDAIPPVPSITREEIGSGVALQDSFSTTSIVVVNPSETVVRPNLFRLLDGKRVALHLGTVAPNAAVEMPLEEGLFRSSKPIECGWGLVRAEAIYRGVSEEEAALTASSQPSYFVVYRDPVTKKPVSVSML
jgi:hypothetical protein